MDRKQKARALPRKKVTVKGKRNLQNFWWFDGVELKKKLDLRNLETQVTFPLRYLLNF